MRILLASIITSGVCAGILAWVADPGALEALGIGLGSLVFWELMALAIVWILDGR